MAQLADSDEVTELGREVARQLVGADTVNAVEVKSGFDTSDEPAYHFWFRWDKDPDWRLMGLMRGKLAQKLRDELMARGDPGYPYVHILTPRDCDNRTGA
jgi:hypothetical protein